MKINLFKIILALVVLILIIIAYISFSGSKGDTITIGGHVFEAEVVTSGEDLSRGLAGRNSIDDDQAMLFVFFNKEERNFWMKGMKFDIDLLWIEDYEVVGYEKYMKAPAEGVSDRNLVKYRSDRKVDKVLEMNAGLIDKLGIQIGDKLTIN